MTSANLRLPELRKETWPSISANSVSSPPRPTFSPGWILVPRWRTMIVPAVTVSPPKRLTPSILGFESRPLLDEPPPFLCAMRRAPLTRDLVDADAGEGLAVTVAVPVPRLVLVLED